MQAEDFDVFAESLRNVHSFYGKDVTDFAMDVWWTCMKPYDLNAIRAAFGKHCVNPDNGQFPPKPADIVRFIEGSTLDAAMTAWTKIEQAIKAVGTYSTVVFDDPLIHAVLADMGGWPQLGQKSVDEWPFVGKEFQTRYRGYKAQRELPAYPRQLTGIADQTNAMRGFKLSPPAMIGDPESCQRVIAQASDKPRLTVTPFEGILKQIERTDAA